MRQIDITITDANYNFFCQFYYEFIRRFVFGVKQGSPTWCPHVPSPRKDHVGRLWACCKNDISIINVFRLTNINIFQFYLLTDIVYKVGYLL